jgi:RNA polymerase sigma factor (sigma-70 family)
VPALRLRRIGHNFARGSNMRVVSANELSRCSDEELLVLGARDAQAFGLLYDRYEDPLLAFFRRATGHADLAADLTAEVFAVALASLGSFRAELGSARGWLFGIARHELAQSWRRGRVDAEARRRLGMEPIVLSDENLERIDRLGEAGAIDSLTLLEGLPIDQREAVRARVIDGRDYEELAHELGCSELVVRQRVSRGLRALRALAGPR